jgi:regulator of replication initiation timing
MKKKENTRIISKILSNTAIANNELMIENKELRAKLAEMEKKTKK